MDKLRDRYYRIKAEWKKFVSDAPVDEIDTAIVRAPILRSWIRCRDRGANPFLKKIPIVLQGSEVDELLESNAELIRTSEPFLNHLYQSIADSGFFCALCDHRGYILKLVGDESTIKDLEQGVFVIGALTSEEGVATNGIGTALIEDTPVQVFATEHYCESFHRHTCSGAPIHDENGKIIGVIDVAGPYPKANPHTLGMAVAAANAIENLLRQKKSFMECQMAENFQRMVISSIPEAIIVTDNKGTIGLINQNAQRMLSLDPQMVFGENIRDVLGKKNESFLTKISNHRSMTDEEVRIYNKNGGYADYTLSFNLITSPEKQVTGKLILLSEISRARTMIKKMTAAEAKVSFSDIIGQNTDFLEIIRLARIASKSTSNVLLLGESGTGKDIFAQAIHNNSDRRDGPYVVINCAAIPRNLIASELFGYDEGAFTGSKRGGNPGKFEIADGGTIFLDEIGEMPLELQTTLLRIIENKEIMRVGGNKVRSVNVRILAATNKSLLDEVANGNFREDLYYRLNVFTIRIPPLRERKDDIPLLMDRFVKDISNTIGKPVTKIRDEVVRVLMNYSWPGNVRQLQNVLERTINIAPDDELTANLLPEEITTSPKAAPHIQGSSYDIKDIERQMIESMIKSRASKSEIAKKMNISRSTLYRKLERYGL